MIGTLGASIAVGYLKTFVILLNGYIYFNIDLVGAYLWFVLKADYVQSIITTHEKEIY